jgi:exopolysaccharide biosynthesis polyprenyl glycosylphosphotransferase
VLARREVADLRRELSEESELSEEPEESARGVPAPRLRRLLVSVDVACVATAVMFAVVQARGAGVSLFGVVAGALATGAALLVAVTSQGLYRARVCALRANEVVRLGRAAILAGVGGALLSSELDLGLTSAQVGAEMAVALVLLIVGRGAYRSWVGSKRRQGDLERPVMVIGTPEERRELEAALRRHPHLGFKVRALVGPGAAEEVRDDIRWKGPLEKVEEAVSEKGPNGAMIAINGLPSRQVNAAIRKLLAKGVHIHVAPGLRGVDRRRTRWQSVPYEPFVYLEPGSLSGWQEALKRCLDVVLASVGLVLAAPVLAVAALAIKVGDGGPVFFRQQRVARGDGKKTFTLVKLRSMCHDAEQRQAEVAHLNKRHGPLFKVIDDPRVTPVGRILRATSLDELPQLVCVLRGTMSLVGPRPALPCEVEEFERLHPELHSIRHQVKPGITGLWQVEARDDPSFDAYERFDTFYLDNWSILLDLVILGTTVKRTAGRALRLLFRRRSERPLLHDVIVLD